MAGLITKKLQASTLLEVLISTVIITVIFTLAIGIYSRVTHSGFSLTDKQVQQQMDNIIVSSRETNNWESEDIGIDEVIYRKKVSNYSSYSSLLLVEIEALRDGKQIASVRQIVKKENDETIMSISSSSQTGMN